MDLLQEGAAALGLELTQAKVAQFHFYLTQLQLWNQRVNLTALKTDRDIVIKHFLDSLAILPFLGEPRSLADLGSGPGFPGLALKLVRPELKLTLVEAREKKAAFLEYLVSCLKLPGVTVAGKTGTAERGLTNMAWFIAFAPADAPKLAIAVLIENGGHGGEVAAPIAAAGAPRRARSMPTMSSVTTANSTLRAAISRHWSTP